MTERFIFELAILLAAAFSGGLLVKRLGYPAALGELILGIIIGPFALGFVQQSELTEIFAELGAIFLLFYIGLETELNVLKKYLFPSFLVGIVGAILPLALGYYGGLFLGYPEGESLFLGAVITATSIGITVRMLSDLKKLHTPYGHTILGAGVIDDIIAVILLTLVLDLLAGQFEIGRTVNMIFMISVFWAIILFTGTRILSKIFDRVRISPEELLIILLAIGFGVAYVSAEAGMSTIIGAFAIGVSLSGMKKVKSVLEKGHGLYLFFVPIFFVTIGMLIDINLFTANIGPALFITGLAVLGKVGGGAVAALLTGSSRINALRIGVGMSPRGEMGLIIAGIGLASGLISDDIFTISVVAVALTTIIGMPALKILLRENKPIEKQEVSSS
jgi:Kef-type K+ transport system membrane component KefB